MLKTVVLWLVIELKLILPNDYSMPLSKVIGFRIKNTWLSCEKLIFEEVMFETTGTLVKKCLLNFSLLLALSPFAQTAYAQDEFCGMPDEASIVAGNIPILKQGNIQDFLATNSLSRTSTVSNTSDIASVLLLLNPELNPTEIIRLTTFFSDFYDYMTASADEGIDQALSSQLVAAIEQNYSATPVPFRKIRFNYSRNNEVLAKEVQYFIYGTYTFIADGNVSLTANVVNIGSNEQRSFSASGSPDFAVRGVAKQIFEAFQRPASPEFINPLPGRTWLPLPSSQVGRELNAKLAPALCASQGGRLPTREEVEIAYGFGEYFSMVAINPRRNYIVEEDGEVMILNINQNQCVAEKNTSIDKGLLVCIRD